MSTQDLASTLKTYNSRLESSLRELKKTTSLRLSSTNAEIARQKSRLKDLQDKLCVIQQKITANDRVRLPLDTTELVELEVEGQKEYLHTYKLFHPTPNFVFDLRTKLPIRQYSAKMFDGSVWKSKVYEEGGYSFKGEVKTQALKDGYANVVLFGHKRDQHVREIAGLNEALGNLNSSSQLCTTQIEQTEAEITELELVKEQLLTQFRGCNRDLEVMGLVASSSVDLKGPEAFLLNKSVSGLAAYHGLITMGKIKEGMVPKPDATMLLLFRAFETEFFGTLEFLEKLCQNFKNAGSDIIASSRELIAGIKSIALDEVSKDFATALSKVKVQRKRAQNSFPQVQALSQNAIDEIQRLDSNFKSTSSVLKMNALNLEKKSRSRHIALYEEYLEPINHYIDLTHKELQACTASIAAVLLCNYVGVIAATEMIKSSEGIKSLSIDVWMDVYRGVKAGMIEHKWKEFPPSKGTADQPIEASREVRNIPKRKNVAGSASR